MSDTAGANDIADEVFRAELERCRAVGEADWDVLESLLDDSLTHIHMNGRVDDKSALLANLKQRPRTLRRDRVDIRVYDDIAILTGPQYLDLGGGEVKNQTTEVWQRADVGWRLLAFHASRDDSQ